MENLPPLNYPGLRRPSFFQRRREKVAKSLDPVVFAPVTKQPFKPQTRIKMITSIHGKFKRVRGKPETHYDLVAGKSYWVDQEKADEFIVKGYAEGILSREYSDDERAAILATIQVIDLKQGGLTNG